MKVSNIYTCTAAYLNDFTIVVMIDFTSSMFSGSESFQLLSVSVMISGGIVSSRDIDVFITFTPITADG